MGKQVTAAAEETKTAEKESGEKRAESRTAGVIAKSTVKHQSTNACLFVCFFFLLRRL